MYMSWYLITVVPASNGPMHDSCCRDTDEILMFFLRTLKSESGISSRPLRN